MSVVRRNIAGIHASALSFFREPLNLALLVVLPALSIQIYGIGYGQFSEIGVLRTPVSLETTARITGAVFATGALAGVLGLFQIISARDADRRLSLCGYPAVDLLVSRFITLFLVCLVIATVSTISLKILLFEPLRAPLSVFFGLLIGGIIYAMLGMLVGAILPRALDGSLVLVIIADMDNVLASGIFQIKDIITQFSPLSYSHDIVTQAVLSGDLASTKLLPAMTFILVFGILAVIVYTRTVDPVATGGTSQ